MPESLVVAFVFRWVMRRSAYRSAPPIHRGAVPAEVSSRFARSAARSSWLLYPGPKRPGLRRRKKDHHVTPKHLGRYIDEFTFRLNQGNVKNHTLARLASFVDGTAGKRLTYKALIA